MVNAGHTEKMLTDAEEKTASGWSWATEFEHSVYYH